MKFNILFCAAFIVFQANVFAVETEKDISSKITNVTVFLQGAQVTRQAETLLPAGKTVLRLTGISPYIDEASIQVRGDGAFTVLSVNHRKDFLQPLEETPEVKELISKIEDLEKKNETEKNTLEILKEKESFLITNKNIGGRDQSLTPENFRLLFDIYSRNMEQVKSLMLEKTRIIKDNEKELVRLKQQLGIYQNRRETPKSEIFITVSSKTQVNGKFRISYLVGNAGWSPSYDIRVDNINDPVSLVYKANVYQTTGVEWKNVMLTFSNASPDKSGNVPVPYPYFIDFEQVYDDMVRSSAYGIKKMEMAVAEDAEVAAAPRMATIPVDVGVSYKSTSVEFNIEIPYTIPSESKSTSIDMLTLSLPADFRYKSVPRLDTDAFLIARVRDWEQYDLLEGEANLYFENTFVGKSFLNTRFVSDTLDVSLGRDMGVIVKREKRKDFTSQRFIGSNKVETRSWEISVRNNKKENILIEITDQVPVSQNKDIVVEIQELSGGNLDKDKGFVSWMIELEPGKSKNMVLTYSVRYPKDKRVVVE